MIWVGVAGSLSNSEAIRPKTTIGMHSKGDGQGPKRTRGAWVWVVNGRTQHIGGTFRAGKVTKAAITATYPIPKRSKDNTHTRLENRKEAVAMSV